MSNKQQQIDIIRLKLEKAEKSGFTRNSMNEILVEAKRQLSEKEKLN